MTDWIKGIPKTLYDFALPQGYSIHVTANQHESGKITITQTTTKIIGKLTSKGIHFNPNFTNTEFYDKLNEAIKETTEI